MKLVASYVLVLLKFSVGDYTVCVQNFQDVNEVCFDSRQPKLSYFSHIHIFLSRFRPSFGSIINYILICLRQKITYVVILTSLDWGITEYDKTVLLA